MTITLVQFCTQECWRERKELARFDAGRKLDSVYAAFAASEINYLFIGPVELLREVDDGRAARVAARILVTGTIRMDMDGTRIKHLWT